MAMGDISGNVARVCDALAAIKCPVELRDSKGLAEGQPRCLLPILHYLFLSYSPRIATYLSKRNYHLFAQTDFRFVQSVLQIMRKECQYRPTISPEQFFRMGYAERKLHFVYDVIQILKNMKKDLASKVPIPKGDGNQYEREEGAMRSDERVLHESTNHWPKEPRTSSSTYGSSLHHEAHKADENDATRAFLSVHERAPRAESGTTRTVPNQGPGENTISKTSLQGSAQHATHDLSSHRSEAESQLYKFVESKKYWAYNPAQSNAFYETRRGNHRTSSEVQEEKDEDCCFDRK